MSEAEIRKLECTLDGCSWQDNTADEIKFGPEHDLQTIKKWLINNQTEKTLKLTAQLKLQTNNLNFFGEIPTLTITQEASSECKILEKGSLINLQKKEPTFQVTIESSEAAKLNFNFSNQNLTYLKKQKLNMGRLMFDWLIQIKPLEKEEVLEATREPEVISPEIEIEKQESTAESSLQSSNPVETQKILSITQNEEEKGRELIEIKKETILSSKINQDLNKITNIARPNQQNSGEESLILPQGNFSKTPEVLGLQTTNFLRILIMSIITMMLIASLIFFLLKKRKKHDQNKASCKPVSKSSCGKNLIKELKP